MSVDITTLSIEVKSVGIKEASNSLGGLSTSAANTERRIRALIVASEKLNAINVASVAAMNSYMIKLQQQAALMHSLSTGSAGAAASTAALASAMALLAASLNALNQRTQQADRSQRRHNEGMREAHGLARGLAGSLGALWVTYGNLAGMAIGLAIGASLKGVITIGKDVEHTLESIRVKGMETVDAIGKVRDAIMDLGTGVYGPQEVAKAFETLVMAGLNAKDAVTGIKSALDLAIIGGTSVDKAAFTLVQVSTSLGYTAEGFSRVGDVIAKTAAVSMSSVESLSEAFKSGSVVGKLYGVSLVDIGVAFAALSNLGIKGSAAGTSLKNMYKELAADSKKLADAMALIGLKPGALQDAQGNFLPLVSLFKELDKGLGQYGATEQKTIMGRIANERGMKSLIEIYSLYRTELSKSEKEATGFTTKLESMTDAINRSYGFMAQGAAAMALTVDSQFKSVSNTLKVTLVKAFQDIQPELSVVASSLKRAFGSSEFTSAIQNLALGAAKLAVFMIESADAIWLAVRALLAFKAASMVAGIVSGIGAALMGLKVALDTARISAIAFQASLGLLGLALAAGAALMVLWATERDKATDAASKAALDYMDDFTNKIKENSVQVAEQIRLMKEGKTASEAYTLSQQELALQKVKSQGVEVIGRANENRGEVFSSFSSGQKKAVTSFMADGKKPALDYWYNANIDAINRMVAANKNLEQAKLDVAKRDNEAAEALKKNITLNKELAEIADAQAAASRNIPGGGKTIEEEATRAQQNAQMNAELSKVQGEIDRAKKQAEQEKQNAQSEYKRGLIGELTLSEKILEAEKERQATIGEGAAKKIAVLSKYANQESAIEQEKANLTAAYQATVDATQDDKNRREEFSSKIVQESLKRQAEAYKNSGQFVMAYLANEGRLQDIRGKQLQDSYDKSTDSMEMFRIAALMEANDFAKAAGIKAAANKEAENTFNTLADATRNMMKGVQTATENDGLAAMFTAAQAASEAYMAELPALELAMQDITNPKGIEEAKARMINLADTQRKMWVGVGESIKESLTNAFGAAGESAGKLISIAVSYGQTQDKIEADRKKAHATFDSVGMTSAQLFQAGQKINADFEKKSSAARIKAFGDAAGAAKSFFKEGTTGYKVMEGAEKAFRLIELAGMAKSLAVTVATAAAKATAWIPAVLMSFMASMGPWGLAAAGVAIAAVLGGAFGGGGSAPTSSEDRQAKAGKGSVLGDSDAKSESIANSLEILQRNSGLGLTHSSSMVKSLQTIANSIGSLTNLVLRAGGLKDGVVAGVTEGHVASGAAKIFGAGDTPGIDKFISKLFGTRTNVTDQGIKIGKDTLGGIDSVGVNAQSYADIETKKKFFGITTSTKYNTQTSELPQEISDQFTMVIKGFADTITLAASSLGLGGDAFTQKLKTFVVDIGEISIKGLTGEEIEEQFSAIFSKLGDDMAKFGVVGLDKFQKIGEGYFETLARIANDLIQVKDVFAVMGQTFSLTGMAAIEVSQNLITAAGGLDKLTSGTKFFVDNFLTEAEKMGPITNSVTKRLAELGASELTTIELYKQKVQALDLTNAEDQKLYANLLALAPAFKESADYAVQLAEGTTELTKAQQKLKDIADKQRELDIRLMEAQGNTVGALSARRGDELAALTKLSPALAVTQQALYDLEDAAKVTAKATDDAAKATAAAKAVYNTQRGLDIALEEAIGNAAGALNMRRDDELAALKLVSAEMVVRKIQIYAAEDAAKAAAKAEELATTKRSMEISIMEAQGNVAGVLAARRSDELDALRKVNPSLVDLRVALHAAEDAAKAAAKALEIRTKLGEMEIELLEAQGDAAGALSLTRKAELAALMALDPSLVAMKQRIYDAIDANKLAETKEETLKVAKDNLIAAYEREGNALQDTISKLEQTVDKFKAFSASIKKFKDGLLLGDKSTLSPAQKYEEARRQFNATATLAKSGDEKALAELENVSGNFLDASRDFNASTDAYVKDFDLVQNALAEGASAADAAVAIASAQLSAAQSQLAAVNAQLELLKDIKAVLSVRDAAAAYQNAGGVVGAPALTLPTIDPVTQAKLDAAKSYQSLIVPSYAKLGLVASDWMSPATWEATYLSANKIGSHYNGLDEVPFDGYTAKMHRGERIQTAQSATTSDKNSDEMVTLTKELLTRIMKMEEHAEASNTQRGAIAEMSVEQMTVLVDKMEEVKRAVKTK